MKKERKETEKIPLNEYSLALLGALSHHHLDRTPLSEVGTIMKILHREHLTLRETCVIKSHS